MLHNYFNMEGVSLVALANSNTYKRLSNGLRQHCGKEGFEVLMEILYKEFERLEEGDSITDLKTKYNLCEGNIKINPEGGESIKCMCGKAHILNLNIFEYQHENFDHLILGSSCIEHLSMYDTIREQFPELYQKLKEWVEIIKTETQKIENKQCVMCKKYKVRKNYKYKNEARNYWCKDCVYSDYVKCVDCGRYRKYGWSQYYKKPLYQCHKCYFKNS